MADFSVFELSGASPHEPMDMSNGQPFDMFEFGGQTAVAPTIGSVSPAAGSVIGTQAAWYGRITLSTAVIAGAGGLDQIGRIIVWVGYQNLNTMELALAGLTNGDFAPDFSGASSITLVSPGVYDLRIMRNGGWPAAPRIFVHANTTAGGQT